MTGPATAPPRRVAIMQPYLFPYLGYFQLAAAVDEFWLLDTVQFIRRGWMNRNHLLVNARKTLFTVPVTSGPRDQPILEKTYNREEALKALDKLAGTIRAAYRKAPHRDTALTVVQDFARHLAQTPQPVDFTTATETALQSCFDAIGLATPIRRISSLGLDDTRTGQDRIIAACQAINAQEYFNMVGGRDLYKSECFDAARLKLWFLEPALPEYDQGTPTFESGLSILDVLAHVPPEDIRKMLDEAQLTSASSKRLTRQGTRSVSFSDPDLIE
jgi:hypothetical protein